MMKRSNHLNGLIALNIAVLAILTLVTFGPSVQAENAGTTNLAGDYIMVGGEVNGSTSNAIYILDQRSGYLISFLFDRSAKQLRVLAGANVNEDMERVGGGR